MTDMTTWPRSDEADLRRAHALLEAPSLTIKLAKLVGTPIEAMMDRLPAAAQTKVQQGVKLALNKSVEAALWTMDAQTVGDQASTKTHLALGSISGALGGLFGMSSTLVELPVSTTLMMRSVADIARSESFDVRDPAIQAECIKVFAMGGDSADDDGANSAYYAFRNAMLVVAQEVGRGLAGVAAKQAGQAMNAAVSKDAAAWLVKLIEFVTVRFGIIITKKVAVQAVPVIGALSGAGVNAMFMNHFQDMARGHFVVLRLEQKHGVEAVRAAYAGLSAPAKLG